MSAHAKYAPSSAHRWIRCTASAQGIVALGEQESGEEAAEGTRAHDEIERCFPQDWTGHACHRCKTHDDAFGLCSGCGGTGEVHGPIPHPEMVDPDHPAAYGVALVLDYVRQLPPGRLWVEQRVRLTDEIWGRCDVAHWDEAAATLTIVDYKNGFVDVDAVENEQLQIYAAASIYTHNLPAKWIRMVVVQPNSFMPVPRVKQWICSAESLFAFATRVAAIPAGPLTFVAGEQCKYCPLFGRCPASADVLVKLGTAMARSPDDVSPGQVAIFKAMEKPIADYFKSLDKVQLKAALAGRVAPGMKIVTTSKHRAWRDEAAARNAIIDKWGVEVLSPPTPAQAEKLGGVDVEALSEKPEGGPALAFESDKRPTWVPKSAAAMFADVMPR